MNVNLDALSDVTKINISQVGNSTSEFMLERQLLMNEKSYCGTVSKFDIDLGNTHMLTSNPLNYKIFEIKRRDVSQNIETDDLTITHPQVTGQNSQTFTIDPKQGIVNTPGEYTRLLNRFFQTFDRLHRTPYTDAGGTDQPAIIPAQHSVQHTDAGVIPPNPNAVPPYAGVPLGTYLIKMTLDQGGKLHINGSPRFWCNFFIEISDYGQELLGIKKSILSVQVTNGVINADSNNMTAADGVTIILANLNQPVTHTSSQSIFRAMDHRLSVLASIQGLNVPNYIIVQNNQETIGNYVVDVVLPNKCTLETDLDTLSWDFGEDSTITNLIKEPHSWFKLGDVLDLRYFRIELFMRRREYNPATKTWGIQTDRLELGKSDFWNMQLTFVSI